MVEEDLCSIAIMGMVADFSVKVHFYGKFIDEIKRCTRKTFSCPRKKNNEDYALVLGEIAEPPRTPTCVDSEWVKSGEKMVDVYSPARPKVDCIPITRKPWIDEALKELGVCRTGSEIHYLEYPLSDRYIDENIVSPKFGFHLDYLILVYWKDGIALKDILLPLGLKKPTSDVYEKSSHKNLTLTHFFN